MIVHIKTIFIGKVTIEEEELLRRLSILKVNILFLYYQISFGFVSQYMLLCSIYFRDMLFQNGIVS
jgi:hypothetical protein